MRPGVKFKGRVAFCAAILSMLSLAGESSASWPMARHDPQRTGMATGKSDFKKPAAYWKTYLGGSLSGQQMIAADVNGDGKVDIVHVRAGRVAAKSATDQVVWQSAPFNISTLIGVV